MKIGITCYPTFGGSGVVATELGKALSHRGHEIHFIAYAPPQRLSHIDEHVFYHEVNVTSYPLFKYPPYSLALTSKMVDAVRYEELDLLHVHYAIPHAASAVMAKDILRRHNLRVPVVTTLHGTDITLVGQDRSYAPVVAYSIDESDGVTAVSDYLRNETLNHFDVNQDIRVIPNFVDTDRFYRQEKDHFKRVLCPNGEKVIVHISNFREVKRATDVVRTFANLHREELPVKLLMVGDGPDRSNAEQLARELGAYRDVRFLGKQEPVEEILSIADVFMIPSGSETFGLAALEAMACRVPVVSSDIGGLPELNIDGETGFLCELGDVDAYTDCIRRLLTDEELHDRLAENAYKRAVNKFSMDQIVPEYESFYEEVRERMFAEENRS